MFRKQMSVWSLDTHAELSLCTSPQDLPSPKWSCILSLAWNLKAKEDPLVQRSKSPTNLLGNQQLALCSHSSHWGFLRAPFAIFRLGLVGLRHLASSFQFRNAEKQLSSEHQRGFRILDSSFLHKISFFGSFLKVTPAGPAWCRERSPGKKAVAV